MHLLLTLHSWRKTYRLFHIFQTWIFVQYGCCCDLAFNKLPAALASQNKLFQHLFPIVVSFILRIEHLLSHEFFCSKNVFICSKWCIKFNTTAKKMQIKYVYGYSLIRKLMSCHYLFLSRSSLLVDLLRNLFPRTKYSSGPLRVWPSKKKSCNYAHTTQSITTIYFNQIKVFVCYIPMDFSKLYFLLRGSNARWTSPSLKTPVQ